MDGGSHRQPPWAVILVWNHLEGPDAQEAASKRSLTFGINLKLDLNLGLSYSWTLQQALTTMAH